MSHDTAPLLRNHAKEKLANGRPVFSMTVRLVRTVDIASIAYTAGFDSVYIDLEHSSFPLDAARPDLHGLQPPRSDAARSRPRS